MAKFEPIETDKDPILVRTPNNKIICLVDYKDLGDNVRPISGYDVTSGYERLRTKDANAGVPLVQSGDLKPLSVGEVAYRAAASAQGWGDTSWSDLDSDEKENWNHIGRAMKDYLQGDNLPYIY